MNKFVLVSFLLACVGCAFAGYGAGTPGYYDAWTYYGGYDTYYNNRYNYGRYQPRPYYPISRYSGGNDYQYNRQRTYSPTSRYNNYGRYDTGYNRPSYGRSSYNRISYNDRMMNDEYYY